MLQVQVIGNLGADAQVQTANGREFTSFRVAHSEKWKDASGVPHEETTWVDCVIDGVPKVIDFLKKGQMVYVSGHCKLRTYSSQKDRCIKAGLQISTSRVELLGGRTDDVPSLLYCGDNQTPYKVVKIYGIPDMAGLPDSDYPVQLHSDSGENFLVDREGWVSRPEKTPKQ